MNAELTVLRLVHVLGGMFWVGTALLNAFFLLPAMAAAGPAAAPVFGGLQRRRLFTVLPIVALLTLLSGARLLQITSGNFDAAYFRSPSGRTFAWAGVLAIVAFLIGMAVVRPLGPRLAVMTREIADMPPGGAREAREHALAALQRRMMVGNVFANLFLVAAAAGMAIARYVVF